MTSVAKPTIAETQSVYFSHIVSIGFKNSDPVAQNQHLQKMLENLDSDRKRVEETLTSFMLEHHALAHFLHMMYCVSGEGDMIILTPDGIESYVAGDENGIDQQFNGQLFFLSQLSR
jgi:hypothetical protein